jgi:hypothetical protein
MNMSVDDVTKFLVSLEQATGDALQHLVDRLPLALPIDLLIQLGGTVAKEIAGRTEKEQMQQAVDGIDQTVALEEANLYKK